MSDYQRNGCPLIQHFWPFGGRQEWIVWNWTTGRWDTREQPEVKR